MKIGENMRKTFKLVSALRVPIPNDNTEKTISMMLSLDEMIRSDNICSSYNYSNCGCLHLAICLLFVLDL